MKRILVLMLVAIAMLMFVSCDNKTEEPVENLDYTKLKGTWRVDYGTRDYISVEFKEDKVASVSDYTPNSGSGCDYNITIKGNTVTFTNTLNSAQKYSYKAEIDGNNLILTQVGEEVLFDHHSDKNPITLAKQG